MPRADTSLPWRYDDGGRAAAGYRGEAGDCVVRAIAIATQVPYDEVYHSLYTMTLNDASALRHLTNLYGSRAHAHVSPRTGVLPRVYKRWLAERGWIWTPTMHIGSGTTVHLAAGELPAGRLLVRLSRHLTAVIDGIIHDTDDPAREGTRAVYGYWRPKETK